MKVKCRTVITIFCLLMCCSFATPKTGDDEVPGNWTATYYGNTYKTVRHTANGDVFNKNAMTCATPKRFKFGTKLRITNVKNGKSIIVTVTDRGANDLHGNTIDLTHGAFAKIATHKEGRVKVKVEVVK